MLSYIKVIEAKLESQPLLSLSEVKNEVGASVSGFYWIYSNLPMEEFKKAAKPKNPVHVDFMELSEVHAELKHVISPVESNYWCIYNGKGKQLRHRIVAEFTDTKGKTGKLALLRCFKEENFRIKYVVCGDEKNAKGIATQYADLERNLERVWRLQLGWPVLCRA